MEKLPLVSVITPSFNASRFLPRVIKCVQNQHGIDYEHIIVDDCSTDESLAILLKLSEEDERIKIIRFIENQGVVKARNAAIAQARGKYLAFLDADDIWLPKKLQIQSEFMQNSGAVISFTDYRFISYDGSKIGRLLRGPNRVGWKLHHATRYLGCLTIMVDHEKCPGFFFDDVSTTKYSSEDFLAWSKIIKHHGPALRCAYDLGRYSIVHNSRSRNGIKAAKSIWGLYRNEEKIPLLIAMIYFFCYSVFAVAKRYICRPIWPRHSIDKNFD